MEFAPISGGWAVECLGGETVRFLRNVGQADLPPGAWVAGLRGSGRRGMGKSGMEGWVTNGRDICSATGGGTAGAEVAPGSGGMVEPDAAGRSGIR